MAQETLLTIEGLKELEAELEELKTVGRKEAAEKIKVARSFGDLSENSEYDEAMSDQAKLEARISEIEHIIKTAKVLDVESLGTENVHIGSTVKIVDKKKKEFTYTIVGFAQADPAVGKISDESPVGKALIGHKVGDKVIVEAPAGAMQFKIVEILK
ncbi:MAG: transcription elongation factor GreA [Candidatus Fimenecus sp.]